MWVDGIFLVLGGFFVWLGAEGMVQGSVRLARHLGVPSLVIGLTIVALGTSAPELVVSTLASLKGHSQIALGNVLGSNIINIGLVLGLSALIRPLAVSRELLRRDLLFLLILTLSVAGMIWLGSGVDRWDGAILMGVFVTHTLVSYRLAIKAQERMTSSTEWHPCQFTKKDFLYLVGGTIVLSLGAEAMVRGAVGVADGFGVDKRIIGMTIVAFGTSVPELAASVVAARHGESDLAIGNVIGSNVYNILLILGAASLIRPIHYELGPTSYDLFFFVIMVLVLPPMLRWRWRLGRLGGAFLLGLYAVSVVMLFV
jgi:cation:H+ antiporter